MQKAANWHIWHYATRTAALKGPFMTEQHCLGVYTSSITKMVSLLHVLFVLKISLCIPTYIITNIIQTEQALFVHLRLAVLVGNIYLIAMKYR